MKICFLSACALLLATVARASIATTGLLDHFDPNQGVTTNELGRVTAWANQAAVARGATTSATTVTVSTDSGGRKMLSFASANDAGHLSYPSPGDPAMSGGYTIFVVVDWNPGNSFPRLLRGQNDTHALFCRPTTGFVEFKVNTTSAGSARAQANYTTTYGPSADPTIAIITARATPTGQELYFNGTRVDARNLAIPDYSLEGTFQIGNSVIGRIGHVLVYDNTPSLQDLGKTGVTLARAYGVDWDSSILDPESTLEIASRHEFGNTGSLDEFTIPFSNIHPENSLTLTAPISISGPDAGFFATGAYDETLAPGAGGSITVNFDPTLPGGGARSYEATLEIQSDDPVFPVVSVQLSVASHAPGTALNPDPVMKNGLASYQGTGVPVSPGLANDPSGMIRVRGTGDPSPAAIPDTVSQGTNVPDGLPDWQLDFHFTPADLASWPHRTNTSAPNGAFTDRTFQLAVLAADVGTSGYGDTHAAETLINLAYLPDGAGDTVGAAGFYLFDGSQWVLVPQLGTIAGSSDADTDENPFNGVGDGILDPSDGDTVHAYRMIVTGTGFARGSASYDILLSGGELSAPRVVTGLTTFHAKHGNSHAPAGYLFTAADSSQDSNGDQGIATSFWVDDVHFMGGAGAGPLSEIVTLPGPIYVAGPATTGTTSFLLRNRGVFDDLAIDSIGFSHPAFAVASPSVPFNIPPGAIQEVVISFDATAIAPAKAISATATVTGNDNLNPVRTLGLKAASGTGGLPGIPADGLVDHFDASQGILAGPGGEVLMWTNLAAPLRSTGGGTLTSVVTGPNGHPMVRFNAAETGLDDFLSYPATDHPDHLKTGFAIVAVVRLNAEINAGNTYPRILRGANDTPALFVQRPSQEIVMKADPIVGSTRPRRRFDYKYAPGDVAIMIAWMEAGTGRMYFNGELVDTRTVNSGSGYVFTASGFEIGNNVKGDIGHVLLYDHTVTPENLGLAGKALANAYGVGWDSSGLGPVSADFAAWAANPALGIPEDKRGFHDDADGDGLANGIEHFLGTPPASPGAAFTSPVISGEGGLVFRHTRARELASDVSGGYEWSVDLANWHAGGETAGGISVEFTGTIVDATGPEADEIEVTATVSGGNPSTLFLRIKAVQE